MIDRKYVRAVLAAGISMMPIALQAQTSPIPDRSDDAGIDDIIVTAQRREERLQDVPISITAKSGAALADANIRQAIELPQVTPGLTFSSVSGAAVIFIRGVGTANPVVGNESSVAVYVDGIYMPSQKGSQSALGELERVEILKGPQGTLFGRNATGGAIQFITKDPTQEPVLKATATYENYNTVQGDVYASTGLTPNLAINVTGSYRKQMDGWGTYVPTGQENMKGKEYSGRTKAVWTPTDTFKVTASASFLRISGSLNNSLQLTPNSVAAGGLRFNGDIYDSNFSRPPIGRVRQFTAMLRMDLEASFANLVSLTGYSRTTSYYYLDNDLTPAIGADADLPERQSVYSQEFQLQSLPGSPITWIAGVYLYHNISGFNVRITGPAVGAALFAQRRTRGTLDSMAAFAQATIPLAEYTNITVGGRVGVDDLAYKGSVQSALGQGPTNRQRNSNTEPSWRISLDQKIGDSLVYASYNRGYKAGNFNLINAPSEKPTSPETLDAFEVGFKGEFLDRRLTFNASAFYYDFKNLQVLANFGGTNATAITQNAAAARIKGLEAELSARPVEYLSLNVGASYLHDRFKSYPNAVLYRSNAPAAGNTTFVGSAAGNRLPRTPDYTINGGATVTLPMGGDSKVVLSANALYNPGFYWHSDNRIREDDYTIVNAGISFVTADERYTIKVFARNLLDEEYYAGVQEGTQGDYAAPGAPRTYGVSLGVKL